MSQFTVVANTSSHVLYLDIGNIAAIKLFAELINGNSNECTVKHLQTASLEFKERLQLLDKIGERVYKMKRFSMKYLQVSITCSFLVELKIKFKFIFIQNNFPCWIRFLYNLLI